MWTKHCGETHHQENESHSTEREEFETRPRVLISHLIDVVFVLFFWSVWNCQVSLFSDGYFQPTPFLNLSNAPSLTLLFCLSLSLSPPLSVYSPLCLHLSPFDVNIPTIWKRDHWINLIAWTLCFTYGFLTITCQLKPRKGAGMWWVMEPHWRDCYQGILTRRVKAQYRRSPY